jgi:hypothetical protein
MSARHFSSLCRSREAPLARQKDTCVSRALAADRRKTSPHSNPTGGALRC